MVTAEDEQIRFPVAKGLAIFDLGRPMFDQAGSRDERCARLATIAWSPLSAGFGQVTVKAGGTTFRAVDVAIDRLVTDATTARAVQPQPPGDLLRRPTALELVDDVAPQDVMPVQLAQPLAALPGAIWAVSGK